MFRPFRIVLRTLSCDVINFMKLQEFVVSTNMNITWEIGPSGTGSGWKVLKFSIRTSIMWRFKLNFQGFSHSSLNKNYVTNLFTPEPISDVPIRGTFRMFRPFQIVLRTLSCDVSISWNWKCSSSQLIWTLCGKFDQSGTGSGCSDPFRFYSEHWRVTYQTSWNWKSSSS